MPLRSWQRRSVAPLALGLALILVAFGCGAAEESEPAASGPGAAQEEAEASDAQPTAQPADGGSDITSAAREEAAQIFETRCFTCHGKRGQGDGPASAGLDPQPRDLTESSWQNSVSDEHIEQIILYGGAAVGMSPAMPANPDLTGRPAVVAALVEHVRNLASEGSGSQGGAR